MKKVISLVLALLAIIGILALSGCNNGDGGEKNDGSDTKSGVKGSVRLAVPNWNIVEIQSLVEAFNEVYPDVDVEFDGFDGSPSEYLAAHAVAGDMPDVLWGDWGNIPSSVAEGWLYPLDGFLDKDDEKQYIPTTLLEDYTYNGKVYAIPNEIHFYGIVVNKDLVKSLNMDMPKNNWSVDDYQSMLRKAATDKTSGTENLFLLDEFLCGVYNKDIGINTYNKKTQSFSFAQNYVKAVNVFKELRAVTNLEAWSLRGQNATETENDYTKRFNIDKTTADSDGVAAFKTGKVLTSIMGTFDTSWLRYMTFDWDILPLPQADQGARLPLTANASYMISTCENPEAAYKLLKWISFGSEGNLVKLDYYEKKNAEDLTSGYLYFFPVTSHPDVAAKFPNNKNIPDGCLFMYENLNNSFRQDLAKILPGYQTIAQDYVGPKCNEIRSNAADAAAVTAELDSKVNTQIKSSWNDFNDELSVIQEEFDEAHK